MTFEEIDVNTYSGNIPTDTDLVVAESGDVKETALVLYGFDEIGMFDDEFNNPVYGFLGNQQEIPMEKKRIKIERWLDRYNHIMELMRTILAITTILLQLYIISKLV